MLQRNRGFHRGGIYNLWATRRIANKIKKLSCGKKAQEKSQNKFSEYSPYNRQTRLLDIKYEEPGNIRNLWASKRPIYRIRSQQDRHRKLNSSLANPISLEANVDV